MQGKLPEFTWGEWHVVTKEPEESDKPDASVKEKPAERTGVAPRTPESGPREKNAKPEKELCVLERSAETKLPVFLYFHAEETKRQRELSRTYDNLILRQKTITELGRSFHACRIDAVKVDDAIIERYKINAAPMLVFLDCEGKIMFRWKGRLSPENLESVMRNALLANAKRHGKPGSKLARDGHEKPEKSPAGKAKTGGDDDEDDEEISIDDLVKEFEEAEKELEEELERELERDLAKRRAERKKREEELERDREN